MALVEPPKNLKEWLIDLEVNASFHIRVWCRVMGKFKAWHVTINDPHYWGEDADLGIHHFDTRNQARARGASESELPYTQIRAIRAPDWDAEKLPGAFLENGRVVQPGKTLREAVDDKGVSV